MSGIYIHIPFCRQACHYCNFHFATSLHYKDTLIQALATEIHLQREYLPQGTLQSIYFGGGTPSLLTADQINHLTQRITKHYTLAPHAEVTLEANPDDLTPQYLQSLKNTLVNRLSIGIQSLNDEDLRYMNRAHNALQAHTSIQNALQTGFTNLSLDLIYGVPTATHIRWVANLHAILQYKPHHISCYALTVEPRTRLDALIQRKQTLPVTDEHTAQQFEVMLQIMEEYGYEQYEISNFCRDGHYAQHNTAYWQGKYYVGIGPSAHSYNGTTRQWNVSNNQQYIRAIEQNTIPAQVEVLTPQNRYNEYVMTSLRTKWGCHTLQVQQWGEMLVTHLLREANPYIQQGYLVLQNDTLYLTPQGKLLADGIISDLFWVQDTP